jgi:hypothetical protein
VAPGTVISLRQILNRPCLRRLTLESAEMRDDCVDQLRAVTGWLRGLDRVRLAVGNPTPTAVVQVREWLGADPSLRHIHWQRGAMR